jgi:mRNA-degrading endonuclease RelE of RelBE toxin-antitoxin system
VCIKKKRGMKFEELDEFKKDLKRLLKKYQTLEDDLVVVRKDLTDEPGAQPPFSFRIEGLGITTCIIKVKKIACRALKGRGVNSGFRLIYVWFEEEERIVFVELYFKGDKEMEDKERIIKHFK